MSDFINKQQLNKLLIEPDISIYRKTLNKKKHLLITTIFGLIMFRWFLDKPHDNTDIWVNVSGGMLAILFVLLFFELIIRLTKITLSITKNKIMLNTNIALDSPCNKKADFIKKSDTGEFWYFYKNGVKVHTIYAAPYQNIDTLINLWLESLDFDQLPE